MQHESTIPCFEKRICVINAALTHTIPRTKVLQPFCSHIDYVDVTGKVLPEEVETPKISYHQLLSGNFLYQYRALKLLFAQLKPDLIIYHFISGSLLGIVLQAAPCPVIGVAMGGDVFVSNDKIRHWRDRRCWKQLNFISAKSLRLQSRLREEGVTASILVNYWGCSSMHPSKQPTKNELRQELGIPHNCRVLLSMRGIAQSYNINCVVEAFGHLVKREREGMAPWHLFLTGRTNPASARYREEIENQIMELALSNRVTIRYDLPQPEMLRYLRVADVTVHLADSEGMPNSLFESWAMGVPAVLRDIPELHENLEEGELIRDGENAFFCQLDPISVANVVERAALLPTSTQIAEKAFADFNRYANIETNAQRFMTALGTLSSGEKPHWSCHFNLLCYLVQKIFTSLSYRNSPKIG